MAKTRKPKSLNTSFNTEINGMMYNICLVTESDYEVGIFTPQMPTEKGKRYLAVVPYDGDIERLKKAAREAVALEVEAAKIAVEVAILSIKDETQTIAQDFRAEIAPTLTEYAKRLRACADQQERRQLEQYLRASLCLIIGGALFPYSIKTRIDAFRILGVPESFMTEASASLHKIAEWLLYIEIENQNAAEAENSAS